jgi:hypothetical protein
MLTGAGAHPCRNARPVTRRTSRPPVNSGSTDVSLWTRKGWPGQEVVGERAHLVALRSVVGAEHRSKGRAVAALVPEPINRFDPQAVAARRYRPALDQIYASGRRPTVTARIWAADYEDWDPDQDATVTRFGAGVHVALDEPHLQLPINSTPTEPHGALARIDLGHDLIQLASLDHAVHHAQRGHRRRHPRQEDVQPVDQRS